MRRIKARDYGTKKEDYKHEMKEDTMYKTKAKKKDKKKK